MRDCPRCGLLSPDQSVRCECGFLFGVDDRGAVTRERARWIAAARVRLFGGLLLAALGGGLSLLGYLRASQVGGSYFIWTGAFIGGCAMVIQAWARIRAIRRIGSGG
jgi:hypothetical protein